MMLVDHTKTSTELKLMVPDNLKPAIPAALDDASQKKITKLRAAKAEDFASEYDFMQVSAHKDTMSLFERHANGGDDSKLKDWAGKTLPALKHHLEMAQAFDKNRKRHKRPAGEYKRANLSNWLCCLAASVPGRSRA
jgi:putative membrane protein